jgi:hypothetical protein
MKDIIFVFRQQLKFHEEEERFFLFSSGFWQLRAAMVYRDGRIS